MSEKYVFIIDTDQYAGNFEREMCACLTGQIGDCEVGIEESVKFRKEVGEDMYEDMGEWIDQCPDEHGTFRPCEIYPTPGYFNNGLGGEFKDGDEEKALKHHRDYCKNPDNNYEKGIDEPLTKYPAYLSVAIYFRHKPSQEIVDLMKNRASEFLKGTDRIRHDPRTMKISGFRLKKLTTTTEDIEI